jgi:PAS domain-containing protein
MSSENALRVVGSPLRAEPAPRAVFCSHCARPPEGGVAPEVGSRVCTRCNLGLLLDAPEALAPKTTEAFVVVDRSLAVHALSKRAEKLLGLRELDAIDQRITDLLVPADAEAQGPHVLSALLVEAAAGVDEISHAIVRPADEFGVRFAARIGPCGPAPGALVVLDLG